MSDRAVSIHVLVENSSLGTVKAGTLRASVPEAVVRRVMARVRQIQDTPCPTCGGNPTRPDETHFGMCHAGWARDREVEDA